MNIMIIGGTRNVGHFLTLHLLQSGHRVTIFNRGQTPDELPTEVERLHGDRSDPHTLARALAGRSFDAVVDMALYNAEDAGVTAELLEGRIGKYIFLSTGQVYLVREESPRPFLEAATAKPLLPSPPLGTRDHEEWLYGAQKSQAEDVLMRAWQTDKFPVTILRLPMVNSERDHFHRVYNYLLRMRDGAPILIPAGKHLRLRHVYGADVVQAISRVISFEIEKGSVYNIAQEETVTIEEFLSLLATLAECTLDLKYIDREVLERLQLFPNCSPFSDTWMSELDNQKSKLELGMSYTPLPVYLQNLVTHYDDSRVVVPEGYLQREEEIQLADQP